MLPTTRASRHDATPWLPLVALGGVAAVLLADAAGTDDGPGVCVVRRCTGGYCPGCGMSRAARHLTRGEAGAAWSDHPWMVLIAVQVVVATALAVARLVTGRSAWPAWLDGRRVATIALVNVVVALGIWVARLATGDIPAPF